MTNDTSLKSSYALLLESSKNCKFAKVDFFAKYGYKVRTAALEHAISNMQKNFKIFKSLICKRDEARGHKVVT